MDRQEGAYGAPIQGGGMGLMAVAVGVAVLASLARGGRFHRLADADLRWTGLLLLAFGLQLLVDWATDADAVSPATGSTILVASFGLILGWLVLHRHLPGSILVFVGFALNAVVIAANGAMPVDVEAIRNAGVTDLVIPLGKHELLTDETLLPWLADRYPIVAIRTSISIGDVVLAAGMMPLVHGLLTSMSPRARRRALRVDLQTASEG